MIQFQTKIKNEKITNLKVNVIFGNRSLLVTSGEADNKETNEVAPCVSIYAVKKHEEGENVKRDEIENRSPNVMLIFKTIEGLDTLLKELFEVRKQLKSVK